MDYIDQNKGSYELEYNGGWGNRYPDTRLISYYYNKIRPLMMTEKAGFESVGKTEMNRGGGCILEFGCSIGANLTFFHDIGYEVYGVDISEAAINKCVLNKGFKRENFKAVNILEKGKSINEIFDVTFDLIIAPDVLYYFGNSDIKRVVHQFYEVAKPGAVFYASMITYNSDTYRQYLSSSSDEENLTLVSRTGSVTEALYVNIMKDDEQVRQLCSEFKTKYILHTMTELDSMNEAIHYIGRKE